MSQMNQMSQMGEWNEEWRERLALWLRAYNEQRLSEGQDEQATVSHSGAASPIGLPAHVLEALEALPAARAATMPDAPTMRSLLGKDPPLARYGH